MCLWNELLTDRLPRRSPVLPIAKARFESNNLGMLAAAHAMDPRLPPLPVEQVHAALEFMTSAGVGEDFATFLTCSGSCKPLKALRNVQVGGTYWKAAAQIGVPEALCAFGIQFAGAKASSADLERHFSQSKPHQGGTGTCGFEPSQRYLWVSTYPPWVREGQPPVFLSGLAQP